jgi:hypothetical protein
MRIERVMEGGLRLSNLSVQYRRRAGASTHVREGCIGDGDRIFIAERSCSRLFTRAVDLGADCPDDLMFRAFTNAAGDPIKHGGQPQWSGTLRACRCMFDLETKDSARRGTLLDSAVRQQSDFALI